MAGMLPGVESARRRRFHHSNLSYGSELSPTTSGGSSTRRSSFCLYTTIHDFHSNSSTGLCEESSRLSAAAREAKKRLDERLQPHWRSSETNRIESRTLSDQQRLRSSDYRPTVQLSLQDEVPKLKKNGSKRLNWLKLSWKSSEQDECAVCLEHFRAGRGGTLMQLPCGHKFHTNCLMPWLEGNAHCPCCRREIPS